MALVGNLNDALILEAALRFVDDFELLPAESTTTSYCPPPDTNICTPRTSEQSSPSQNLQPPTSTRPSERKKRTRKPKKPQNAPNRARKERNLEVKYLREQVVELERQLNSLQQCSRLTRESQGAPVFPSSSLTEMQKLWRDLASHQQRRRELTHRENIRLKSMMEEQRGILATLTNILKRQMGEYSQASTLMRTEYVVDRILDFGGDVNEFHTLFQHLNAAYDDVGDFAGHALEAANIISDEVHMSKTIDGKHLEFFSDSVFPYSARVTAEAAWNYFRGEGKHYGNGGLYKKAAQTLAHPYTIVEDFTKELLSHSSRADIKVKQVIRRYKESDRDVVLFVADVTPIQIKHKPMSGLSYHFRGYAITQPLSSVPGNEASSLHLRSNISISNATYSAFDPRHMRSVANFITGNISGNIRSYRERIEDALVDQFLVK